MSPAKNTKDLSTLETQPISRAGRKIADSIMAAATFKPNADGSRYVRQYEVHGMEVTEWISAEKFAAIEDAATLRK